MHANYTTILGLLVMKVTTSRNLGKVRDIIHLGKLRHFMENMIFLNSEICYSSSLVGAL